jgi:hypothetical protein
VHAGGGGGTRVKFRALWRATVSPATVSSACLPWLPWLRVRW